MAERLEHGVANERRRDEERVNRNLRAAQPLSSAGTGTKSGNGAAGSAPGGG